MKDLSKSSGKLQSFLEVAKNVTKVVLPLGLVAGATISYFTNNEPLQKIFNSSLLAYTFYLTFYLVNKLSNITKVKK